MADEPTIALREFDTNTIIPLANRAPGFTTQLLSTKANSLLSSVFLKSADAGATVTVKYYQTTGGTTDEGEKQELGNTHKVLTVADVGATNTVLISRIHNKPFVEVTVTGGLAEFSVYVTAVTTSASDIDSALHNEGDAIDLVSDRGLPNVCYDEDAGVWRFIRCTSEGIKVSGTFRNEIDDREFGTATVAWGTSANLITYTPTADTFAERIVVGGDGSGEFTVTIGTTTWSILRNAWNERQIILPFGKKLTTSDTIKIDVENVTPAQSGSCLYEAFIYRSSL